MIVFGGPAAGGRTIVLERHGTGEPLILIHGLAASRAIWCR
jgi:pimeloyl-ACP methyl ester carboxylesterase